MLSPVELDQLSEHVQHLLLEQAELTQHKEVPHSLAGKRILLLEKDLDGQIDAKMALGGTGSELLILGGMEGDLELAQKALNESHFDLICLDDSFLHQISFEKLPTHRTQYVFLTSKPISVSLDILKNYPALTTILVSYPQDRTFSVRNMGTTLRKLLSRDIFGMEKYLSWGTECVEKIVRSSTQRHFFLEEFEQYLEQLGIRGSLKSKSIRVMDELLMNAIYDAPTDQTGQALYNHLDRSIPVQLKQQEYALLRYACDGAYLAISVIDFFGALTRPTILTYLERCFREGVQCKPIPGKGGGGNGLFQMVQSSSLLIFNVKSKIKTEVIALFNLSVQTHKIKIPPSFQYFEI